MGQSAPHVYFSILHTTWELGGLQVNRFQASTKGLIEAGVGEMSNVSLLAAGFSQIIGAPVRTVRELQEEMKDNEDCCDEEYKAVRGSTVSVNQLFKLTYGVFANEHDKQIEYSCSSVPEGDTADQNQSKHSKLHCFIKTLSSPEDIVIEIEFQPWFTVWKLKSLIELQQGIPIDQQRLIFAGRQLCDDQTLEQCNISHECTIHLVLRLRGGGCLQLDDDLLAPDFDYDFTDKEDDGQVFKRGGYVYKRPYGWRRLAIKVHGKPEYGDDTWLGKPGFRTRSSRGEWPVSYHGTKITSANDIVKEGFKDECLKRQLHGKGHYSSPDIDIAEHFAESFTYEGDQYKMVLQNRINMSGTVVIPRKATKDMGEYYVTHQSLDIRPYGILIKKI